MSKKLVARWLSERPKRPYRTLAEFAARHNWGGRKLEPGTYPCQPCGGRGWVYDPDDPPCPIEGNKMRNTLRCQCCGGSGRGTRQACAAAYKEVIDKWKAEVVEYDRLAALHKGAVKKLTADEIHALQELGL